MGKKVRIPTEDPGFLSLPLGELLREKAEDESGIVGTGDGSVPASGGSRNGPTVGPDQEGKDRKLPAEPDRPKAGAKGLARRGGSSAAESLTSSSSVPVPLFGRVVLSRESKGRGGKTVTATAFRDSSIPDPEALARELRRALGCGARVEGDRLILQGDQIDRASEWFVARGARVVRGN
jgi:translation initiation factor 1 (eIF-1/SUI1)